MCIVDSGDRETEKATTHPNFLPSGERGLQPLTYVRYAVPYTYATLPRRPCTPIHLGCERIENHNLGSVLDDHKTCTEPEIKVCKT